MKKQFFVFICLVGILVYHTGAAQSVFGDVISVQNNVKEGNSYTDPIEEENRETDDEEIKNAEPDTSWFDPDKQKKVYTLRTEGELKGLAKLINTRQMDWKVNTVYSFKGITIELGNDITLSSDWTPIGYSSMYSFKGIFNGNGHTIKNLNIKKSDTSNLGLFGYVNGTIHHLTVSGQIKSEGNDVGGVAGHIGKGAVIENCIAKVKVKGDSKVGGVVGSNTEGTIRNCSNIEVVVGSNKVGGIVGENWGGTVEKCGNEAKITSTEKGVGTYGTGGIAGRSVAETGKIRSCYNKGQIISKNECAGGVVGYTNAARSSVYSCYNTGGISGGGKECYAGGVVGMVGEDGVRVNYSYNIGFLKNAEYTGGVLGGYNAFDQQEEIQDFIQNNYYQNNSARLAVGKEKESVGEASYANSIESLSSDKMCTNSMISALGYEYRADSSETYGLNKGYPVLKWQEDRSKEADLTAFIDPIIRERYKAFCQKYPYGILKNHLTLEVLNPRSFIDRMVQEEYDRSNTITNN